VTGVPGFVGSGVACGIKDSGALDLALVATADGRPVPAAAVFTTNKAAAAPVQVSRAHLAATGGYASAVVVNSGNANAATGRVGYEQAERTCALVAAELGCRPEEVLVCSTGLIGIPFPMGAVESGVVPLVAARHRDGLHDAALAIMTTDTFPKEILASDEGGLLVAGLAKGAAMLAPNMATMLALLVTNAEADPAELKALLLAAVAESFNELTVDGATSTNDTVIVLASGSAGPQPALGKTLAGCCDSLALDMARDAEGATKLVRVRVTGAASTDEARRAARKVAESQLVQCSIYGRDPYWGRVVSELGSAGVAFDIDRVSVSYDGVEVCRAGVAVPGANAVIGSDRVLMLEIHLGLGDGVAMVTTTDLTPEYIAENMRTS
jgi:glutamate N-acetyltransferase/amino-acid N-acetyltransferase